MRIGPLTSSYEARAGRRAGASRDAVEPLSAHDLPDHATRPVEAGAAVDPDRRPLPPNRALVAPPRTVTRLADALAATRAYAAPRDRVSSFPAGSLVSLAV
jgi:hypothetical protein